MSDYDSSLPVRTQVDDHERLQSKIVDYDDPSLGMEVDDEGNAQVRVHGDDPAGDDKVLRLSELGAVTPDGLYDSTDNSKPGTTGLIAHTRSAANDETTQTVRVTSVNGPDDRRALDTALHDHAGDPYTKLNPLPVSLEQSAGVEIHDYDEASAVAANTEEDHDYTVTASKKLVLEKVLASASGKARFELQVETAAASDTFDTYAVAFNSTATPNVELDLKRGLEVVAGARVRVVKFNRDEQAQSLYSTIIGVEITV